jgi:uncharacterized membrane protein
MSTIEQSVEVNVPLRTAYNQWTQFEEFPRFMEGVKEVRQTDATRMHWVAEITEQRPDERVAWKNVGGKRNAGVVTFHRLDADHTRMMVQLDFMPEGLIEKLGDALAAPDRRIAGDLQRFKEMIESRGTETGGWRGEVNRTDEA